MIKIFGKNRYHWQPEVSWAIIFWSITITPIFIGLSLLFERTKVPNSVFALFGLFFLLLAIGFHRYFIIDDKGLLRIISLSFLIPNKIAISDIKKIEITKSTITLITDKYPRGITFYMRKWPKKYFLDALALEPSFQGEVELLDNFIKMDYFEAYKDDKKAPIQ